MIKYINGMYKSDWDYFTTNKKFTQNDKVKEYTGLNLPVEVLRKIYFENAVRMYSGVEFE